MWDQNGPEKQEYKERLRPSSWRHLCTIRQMGDQQVYCVAWHELDKNADLLPGNLFYAFNAFSTPGRTNKCQPFHGLDGKCICKCDAV